MTDALLQDVRHALRRLRQSPAFAGAATVVLAIGIAANTALFGALHALQWRQLPVRAPGELIWARGYGAEGQHASRSSPRWSIWRTTKGR